MDVLLIGYIIGFFIAIPAIGPISATVIRRALAGDYMQGVAIGAGSSVAEGIYCFGALVGVEFLFRQMPWLRPILYWGGVTILTGFAFYFLVGPVPSTESQGEDAQQAPPLGLSTVSVGGAALLGFLVTMFNPTLLASWATAIGFMSSMEAIGFADWHLWAFPTTVALGEMTWFIGFVALVRRLGEAIDQTLVYWTVRGMGVVLLALAIWGIVAGVG